MPRTRRFQSLVLSISLVAGLLSLAGPANAAPVQGTAALAVDGSSTRDVLAGTQKLITFTVSNTGAAAQLPIEDSDPSITWVRIAPRQNTTPQPFTLASGAADGWTYESRTVQGQTRALFTGGEIAPGDSETFTVAANAGTYAGDKPVDWLVEVSDNDGQNIVQQLPTGAGALTTTIRVLSVDSILPATPAGITDGTATAGQANTTFTSVVSNHGSQDLVVDPALASSASDTVGDAANATIPAGGNASFTFPVDFANSAGNRTFSGDATATNADAIGFTSTPVTTQAAAAFTAVNSTLQPVASVSGVPQTFSLTVNKTNIPAVELSPDSQLVFDGATPFSANLASVTSVGQNAQQVALTFAPVTIPAGDGDYDLSLNLVGTDDNDAPVSQTVAVNDIFEIDNLIPYVVPELSAPDGQATADNIPVVKDGDTLTFGGEIRESGADGAALDPQAEIIDCAIVVKNEAGVPQQTINVPLSSCSNDGGNITGSFSVASFGLNAGMAVLSVLVEDAAGNQPPAPTESNFVLIDNVVPTLDGAITGCGGSEETALPIDETCPDNRTVRVTLTEPVQGSFLPIDFTVDEQTVLAATSTCTDVTFCDTVTLTLAPPGLASDDETPGVAFAFVGAAPLRDRPTDGPKHDIADTVVTAADGILPPLPTLNTVTQTALDDDGQSVRESYGPQGSDGSYYTNENAPSFTIGGLASGYEGIVAIDTNGNGNYDPGLDGDQTIGTCAATGATVDCQSATTLATGTYDILVTATDPSGNLASDSTGNATNATLVIDQTAPLALGFAAAANTVTVTFGEELPRGRDFAADWTPFSLTPDGTERYVVSGVDGTGASRNVTIGDTGFAGIVSGIAYDLQGRPSTRYRDFAGNYLANFTL